MLLFVLLALVGQIPGPPPGTPPSRSWSPSWLILFYDRVDDRVSDELTVGALPAPGETVRSITLQIGGQPPLTPHTTSIDPDGMMYATFTRPQASATAVVTYEDGSVRRCRYFGDPPLGDVPPSEPPGVPETLRAVDATRSWTH
jgi:hypothetical protein